jgi:hypothetical protein
LAEKCLFIKQAYEAEKEVSIRRYFLNCGILGTEDPSRVVKHLLSEGLYPHRKYLSLHLSQLESYLHWKFGKDTSIEDVFGTDFRLLFDQR